MFQDQVLGLIWEKVTVNAAQNRKYSLVHLFIQIESTSDAFAFACDLTSYFLLHILRVQILWPAGSNGHKSCITKSCFMAIYYFLKLLKNMFLYLDLGIGYSLFLNRNL